METSIGTLRPGHRFMTHPTGNTYVVLRRLPSAVRYQLTDDNGAVPGMVYLTEHVGQIVRVLP